MAQELNQGGFQMPWLSLGLCGATLLLACLPAPLLAPLAYERAALLQGQLWRFWTGPLLHFGAAHLIWDLLVTAAAACWLEQRNRKLLVSLLLCAPLLIGVALLLSCPDMQRYGGLSGFAVCLLAALALVQLGPKRKRYWGLVLAGLLLKTVLEFRTGESLLGVFAGQELRNCPEAHLSGFLVGVVFGFGARLKRRFQG
jgi:rhomboid family GlyGly-CTERM serine protease